jgi:pyrroloquinoline quinone (PQQ) biosynthesis protein C
MATKTAGGTFVDEIFKEVIYPARDQLMESRYFTDLRNGKLTKRRLQGFSLEHTWFNWSLLRGSSIRLIRAEGMDALKSVLAGIESEVTHPDLCMKFGLSLGLTQDDFRNHIPTIQTLAHTGVVVSSPLTIGNAAAGRASGMSNETIVQRYSIEFSEYLPKAPYDLSEDAIEFFTVHGVVDVDHSRQAAEAVAKLATTDRDKELVWFTARTQVQLKLAKFEGIYDAYA